MRSSVSYMLSHGTGEQIMSHPDYEQHAHHHACLLVLIRGIGLNKPRSLQKIFERIQNVNNVKITDSSGQIRDIWIRYIRDHPVENNDWGDFQTHRRLLGLITVGKFDTQIELNELCRVHESLKVKYTNTLYDSRCILFGSCNKQSATQSDAATSTTTNTTTTTILYNNNRKISDGNLDETFFTTDIDTELNSLNSFKSNSTSNSNGNNPNENTIINNNDSSSTTSSSSSGSLPSKYSTIKQQLNNADTVTVDIPLETQFTTPSNFKSRAFFYPENDLCNNLETNILEFISSLFWILESKRLDKSREKIDKIALLLAPFEKKDMIGLDMESRNNRKRCMGRITKHLADLTLQAGLIAESLTLFHAASETLSAISDPLWLGASYEGLCVASSILLYPNVRSQNPSIFLTRKQKQTKNLLNCNLYEKNSLIKENEFNNCNNNNSNNNNNNSNVNSNLPIENDIILNNNKQIENSIVISSASSLTSSSTSSVSSILSTSSSSASSSPSSNSASTTTANDMNTKQLMLPINILQPEDIIQKYREAIINYSKYRHAAVIETEAAIKAARICIEQKQNLSVSMFLQNILYISLNMSEQERVQRFETLIELYQRIGYHRKAAFCYRLAAWRHTSQSNTNPDWGQSYRLMLDSFPGHKLSLNPIDVIQDNCGWPCLQIDLLQQLVFAARRLGHSALATRHMTFLLQTMWKHLKPNEQRDFALQLRSVSSLCEGAPFPLVLDDETIIPPANLTDIPYCEMFKIKDMPPHLRPHKINVTKIDDGPFIFTPIHFSSIDRRVTKKNESKIAFKWVQNDLCEVVLKLKNTLPFDLKVSDIRLLSNGIVFESLPQTVTISASNIQLSNLNTTTSVSTTTSTSSSSSLLSSVHLTAITSPLTSSTSAASTTTTQTTTITPVTSGTLTVTTVTSSGSTNTPNSISNSTTLVTLHGTPIESGTLKLQGYSTHTLGVKSNCYLENMQIDRLFPPNYLIEIIPALPKLDIGTSLPQTATFSTMSQSDIIIVSACLTLFNGEQTECTLTLTNKSSIPIEFLECTLNSNVPQNIFSWSNEDLLNKLPIEPNKSIDMIVHIFADANFLGPINLLDMVSGVGGGGGGGFLPSISNQNSGSGGLIVNNINHNIDTGSSGGMNSLSIYGHASLPSRMNSPINTLKRNDPKTSSFRSNNSGHTSLAALSLAGGGGASGISVGGICSTNPRQLDTQLRFRYSGGNGFQEGYCRKCAVSFSLECLPSAQVTNWDVLPAEISSQFYLVLDVINLTSQEMSLNYTTNKNILIEAKESCRVPVPVQRCPLERLLNENYNNCDTHTSILSGTSDIELTERACSEHITDQVNLQWTLTGTDAQGIASLKGITLTSTMLGLITVAPLQWEIFVDNNPIPSQAEIKCCTGQSVIIGVKISNLSPTILHQLTLTVQFYQDYQNNEHNYRLETRVTTSGPSEISIEQLNQHESAFHECSVIFFTPGRFKADIQCSLNSGAVAMTQSNNNLIDRTKTGTSDNIINSQTLNTETQIWRYIPPIEITVIEQR